MALALAGCGAQQSSTHGGPATRQGQAAGIDELAPTPVEVCLNGQCRTATGAFSREDLVGGLLQMFKANENEKAELCEANQETRTCAKPGLSFFVQGGPVPGVSTYGDGYLTHVGLDKETLQIKYNMVASVSWVGTPVFCQNQYTEVTVAATDDVSIESPGFTCTWAIFPNSWHFRYRVDYIDFDNSSIGGHFDIKGAGLLVAGGGSGNFLLNLPNKGTLVAADGVAGGKIAAVRPVEALPPQVIAAPVPTPDDVGGGVGAVSDVERTFWESVSEANDEASYHAYLEKYPEGRFVAVAKANLQAVETRKRQDQELAFWRRIRDSESPADFESYLETYPEGLFAETARVRVIRLHAAAAEAQRLDEELAQWEKAKGSTDPADTQAYIAAYPRGQFAVLARERLKKLKEPAQPSQDMEYAFWNRIKTSRETQDYQNYLQAYPDGVFAELAKGRLESLIELVAQTEELRFWSEIKNSTNASDFEAYLRKYPQGQFAAIAQRFAQQLGAVETERREVALWESIKDSTRPAVFDDYLAKYPQGRFAEAARARKKEAEYVLAFKDIDFGAYYAVVIGNNAYQNLPHLETAVNDAKAVGQVLEQEYGFKVSYLINADRKGIIDTLSGYRRKLTKRDNLLIYYAGHGWLDQQAERGYWLPVDADVDSPANWISTADITDTLKAMQAKHVMVVADSCYSGTLTRSAKLEIKSPEYLRRIANKRARVALTSGGLEPVLDSGGGGHSVFAGAFIEALKTNTGVIEGTRLFSELRRPVVTSAPQTPEYSDIRFAGHEGGDFLFVHK